MTSTHIADVDGFSLCRPSLDLLKNIDEKLLERVPDSARLGACVGSLASLFVLVLTIMNMLMKLAILPEHPIVL